jgi:hypothetical protein
VQSASALLRHGPNTPVFCSTGEWLSRKGTKYSMRCADCSRLDTEDRPARERADYIAAVQDTNTRAYGIYGARECSTSVVLVPAGV